MKILFFSVGLFVYAMCEIFSIPKVKENIKKKTYDTGVFAMQPLSGKTAVRMGKIAIFIPRIGIFVYILLGIYIFWW